MQLEYNSYQRIFPSRILICCLRHIETYSSFTIHSSYSKQALTNNIMDLQPSSPPGLMRDTPYDQLLVVNNHTVPSSGQDFPDDSKSVLIQNEQDYCLEQQKREEQKVEKQKGEEQKGEEQKGEEQKGEEEKKKYESKQKYRRLKQKLTNMCFQHQQKCLVKESKELSSPNKSRLLTIAIDLEKMTLSKTKDYCGLENKLEAILKILDHKRDHDLIILKHSRFVPSFCGLLKKVPAFHKNEFNHSRRSLELGLKTLKIFCTLSSNRDYMISTNQLTILNSCLSSFCNKEERKLASECMSILQGLISCKIRPDSEQIVHTTIQIVFLSQLGRKMRQGVEAYLNEDSSIGEDYVLKSFQYFHTLYRKYLDRHLEKPVYEQPVLQQFLQQNSDALICFLELFFPLFLLDKEGELKDEELPICMINISLYALKLLNINTHVNLKSAQKNLDMTVGSQLTQALKKLLMYSERSVEEGSHNHQLLAVCSETMIFMGKISYKNDDIKNSLRVSGLLDCLYGHPLKYLMDNKLKSILFPALCSTMDSNEHNIKRFLLESSAENLINYITTQKKASKEMQVHRHETQPSDTTQQQTQKYVAIPSVMVLPPVGSQRTLTRKSSVSSTGSYTTVCTQNSYSLLQPQEQKECQKLLNVLPVSDWSALISDLSRLDI